MYITLNSQFRPFTYDELTKPLQDYTEAYNKVEEQYATLAQQTEAWKNIATQENSPEAYAMYKKYSDELNAVVEDFSRGMTIQNRSKLAGLKSRYASEITPISIAYDKFQKANEYRDTIKQQDPSAIFIKDKYTSLDDFIGGKEADNRYISGDTLYETTATRINDVATNMYMKALLNNGNTKGIYDLNNYLGILEGVKNEVGYDSLDSNTKKLIDNYLASGFRAGINNVAAADYTRKSNLVKDTESPKNNSGDNPTPTDEVITKWYGYKSVYTEDQLDELYPGVDVNYGYSYNSDGKLETYRQTKESHLQETGKKTYKFIEDRFPKGLKEIVKNYSQATGLSEEEVRDALKYKSDTEGGLDYRYYNRKGSTELYLNLEDINANINPYAGDSYARAIAG